MDYTGKELEAFDKATIWRKYIYFLIKKYLKKKILEVGAGIGSFTKNYIDASKKITLTELDTYNFNFLKENFKDKDIEILKDPINKINGNFENILYLNVLEHIKEDVEEINQALEKIVSGGHLIILVPAHQELYGNLDKAVGHFRRYNINFFKNLNLKKAEVKKLYYLDVAGYFLFFLNNFFFKKEVYPTNFKIFVWDKIFTPVTIILDKISGYRFGKNVMCIIEKN
jgi:hypothetical protein